LLPFEGRTNQGVRRKFGTGNAAWPADARSISEITVCVISPFLSSAAEMSLGIYIVGGETYFFRAPAPGNDWGRMTPLDRALRNLRGRTRLTWDSQANARAFGRGLFFSGTRVSLGSERFQPCNHCAIVRAKARHHCAACFASKDLSPAISNCQRRVPVSS